MNGRISKLIRKSFEDKSVQRKFRKMYTRAPKHLQAEVRTKARQNGETK